MLHTGNKGVCKVAAAGSGEQCVIQELRGRLGRAWAAFREDPVSRADVELEPATPSPLPEVSPLLTGLRDRMLEGWCNNESGELLSGVQIRPEHTVLDVGCGDGPFTRFCAARGARVVFVDVLEAKLEALREQLSHLPARSIEAHVSNCDPIPLADGEADVVICTEMLEHVDDPVQVMRELARVGKPGARYVLTVPDPVSEALVRATGADFYFQKPHHVRVIGREEFETLVSGAGLRIERHEYIGAFWALALPLSFMVGQPLRGPWHPVMEHWTRTWNHVLDHPVGLQIKKELDRAIPRTQVIVATKGG
jgi:2-polyprenyl-3-methyl-5-hydroxy-6-metoxy-1,4-benzoquinol methylase